METKMETKDLNSIGLAYLEMVEKKNIEAKKNHANALHKNQKALDVHSDEDEDHNDDPTDGDGDIDAADLKKLRQDADKDDKKFDKKKKSSKKDDDQEKFKAYSGDDADGQQGAAIGEDAKYPHMMYDPKTGKEFKAETPADHEKYAKMGYTHDKPEEIDEAMTMVSRKPHPEGGHIVTLKDKNDKKVVRHLHNGKVKTISKESVEIDEASTDLQEGAARQAALAKGLMDYCKEIGKDHMDHKDFADHAKHVKAGNWDKARAHADDQDTEVREKIHTLAIDHLGQGAASELYGGDRVSLSKNKGDGKLNASYNESVNVDIDHDHKRDPDAKKHNISLKLHGSGPSRGAMASGKKKDLQKYLAIHYGGSEHAKDVHPEVYESVNVDDVLALIDQGYTLDQAEAMVAEACGGGTSAPVINSSKKTDDKKLLKASRKQSKAGENDRNMANDQRSIPAKGADTAPVRSGTKQQQRDFDKAARMAKSKDKVSVAKAPWDTKDEGFTSDAQRKAVWASKNDAKNEELHGDQHKLDHNKDGKIDAGDMKKVRKHGAVQKESVMDRVSNMVEDIRAKNEISELHKKTLGSYAKKAMDDVDTQSRFATEYEKRGMAAKNPGVMDKNFKKANRADDKLRNRKAGINTAIDKMTKESVQEASKPTGIHHPIDPTPGKEVNSKDAAGRAADIRASRNPLSMTEKEFVEMHQVPTTVDPAFDGNVAAKQTAENAKKAPIKQAKTPNIPTAKGDQKVVKSTEAPAANAGVVGESYMDKYAKYIRGEI
tara:strand:- start:3874 stop:6192 length:2319 start_codon:yes stop_codon:yes gene_type:complete